MVTKIDFLEYKPAYIARAFAGLYCHFSENPLTDIISKKNYWLDSNLYDFAKFVQQKMGGVLCEAPGIDRLPGIAMNTTKPDVLVAFTGGKDSAATAVKIKQMGLNPVLFFVKNINSASYAGEYNYAAKVAELLGFMMVTITIKQTGKSDYPDNPIKNQFILSLMVEHGYRVGINKFAQGNLKNENIEDTKVGFTLTDGVEMYEQVNNIFDKITQGTYRYLGGVMESETESYFTLNEFAPGVLDSVMSCTLPYRYKARVNAATQKKFGIALRPHCCGTCYKCASEHLHRVIFGLAPNNKDYNNKCLEVLVKAYKDLANLTETPTAQNTLNWFISTNYDTIKF